MSVHRRKCWVGVNESVHASGHALVHAACCMLLLAVNGFCGVCVSAALLSAYLCLMHVRVLPACSVEQKKKIRGGAAPLTERESMKETCVRERGVCRE